MEYKEEIIEMIREIKSEDFLIKIYFFIQKIHQKDREH